MKLRDVKLYGLMGKGEPSNTTKNYIYSFLHNNTKKHGGASRRLVKVARLTSPEFIGPLGNVWRGSGTTIEIVRLAKRIRHQRRILLCTLARDVPGSQLPFFCQTKSKVELLEGADPSEQSSLRIFLCNEILEGGMISHNNGICSLEKAEMFHIEVCPKMQLGEIALSTHNKLLNGSFQSGSQSGLELRLEYSF
ncbi:hypothetical protein Tco_0917092 [Tanacetum coccineum]